MDIKELDELRKKNLSELTFSELRKIVSGKGRDEEKRLYIHSRVADKFSIYQTKLFLKLGLSADAVSMIWIILGVLSTALLWFGTYWMNILFYIIFLIALFIDYSDGEIARYWMWRKNRKKGTIRGLYIENASHSIMDVFIFLGIGIGAMNRFGEIYYVWAAIALIIMILFNQIFKLREYEVLLVSDRLEKLKDMGKTPSSPLEKESMRYIYNLFKPQTILYSLFFWMLILNVVNWFLLLTTFLFAIIFIKNLFVLSKRLKSLDKDEEKQ
ncbi:MAG: hypothetical protein PHF67_02225 [Candidatus Nanoarchaeia archaeon]|nr:hypothetical protein [Candidatus Nanoarchaeia archaeon]